MFVLLTSWCVQGFLDAIYMGYDIERSVYLFLLILFIYLFGRSTCGILVPRPGMQPAPPAVEA